MVLWQIMIGLGFGMIAALATVIATSRQQQITSAKVENSFFSPPEIQCPICLNNMSNGEMSYIPCGHAFHDKCLRELRKHEHKRCPTCRTSF